MGQNRSSNAPAAHEGREFFKSREKGGELREGKSVGAVGESGGGVVVCFEEDAIDACGDSGASERLDKFGLAAARVPFAAGELDGVGCVEDDGVAEFLEDGEGAHIDDKILIAEGRPAFSEDDVGVAGAGDFFDDVGHVPGGDKLGFFYVGDAAGFCGGEEEIGLTGEEGGDLENVADFGGGLSLPGFVDVGEDWQVQVGFDFGEDAQAFFEARAAEGFDRGAIGFVVGGFEDIGDAAISRDFGDIFRHVSSMGFTFDDARASDEKKRIAASQAQGTERNVVRGDHRRYRR